jgi:hypothetical protein
MLPGKLDEAAERSKKLLALVGRQLLHRSMYRGALEDGNGVKQP